MTTTTNDPTDLPGYGVCLDQMDRAYFLDVIRQSALAHYATLHCVCRETGRCEHCRLSEALAYTETALGGSTREPPIPDATTEDDAEVWHDDDVIELAVDGDFIDLLELERESIRREA